MGLTLSFLKYMWAGFQTVGADQGSAAPVTVFLPDRLGNVDPPVDRVELLLGAGLREEPAEVFGADRPAGLRVEHRLRAMFHVRHDIVPLCGNLRFGKKEFFLFHIGCLDPVKLATSTDIIRNKLLNLQKKITTAISHRGRYFDSNQNLTYEKSISAFLFCKHRAKDDKN